VNELVELICGTGYRPDSAAISAVATTAAVFVALWIPARERRIRRLERLEIEARAATLVSQSLLGLLEVMPNIVAKIREMEGVMLDAPGNEILYGTDECQAVIEKEAFVQQLPLAYLGAGELTVSLARYWCRQIDTRIKIQRNEVLRNTIDWKNHTFVCSLGERLYESAVKLRGHCKETPEKYMTAQKPFFHRLLERKWERK
jgi:hypothetical protein